MKPSKKILHLLAVIVFLVSMLFGGIHLLSASAATELGPGDVAIIGFSFPNSDFAFVLLVDIAEGTEIRFTDAGWTAEDEFFTGEGAVTYTAPENLPAGTVISRLANPDDFTITVEGPFINEAGVAFTSTGDQLFAFQGTYDNPTFLFGLNNQRDGWSPTQQNSQTTFLPDQLVDGLTALTFLPSGVQATRYGVYSGPLSGTVEELLAAISNPDNWLYTSDPQLMPSTDFDVDQGPPSVVATDPEDGAINVSRFSSIEVQFNQNVEVGENWYMILCNESELRSASYSGELGTYLITPDEPFALDDQCSVTIWAASVTNDEDPPMPMVEDYTWSFSVLASSILNVGFESNSPVVLGEQAMFTNLTEGEDTINYLWDFGDESDPSSDENPVHEYAEAGTYQVRLTAWNDIGLDYVVQDFVVLVPADVKIDKSVDMDTDVPLGEMVTYTLTLSNSGQVDAENVSLEDILPEGMTIGELVDDSPGEIDPLTNSLSWSGTVPAEDEVLIVFTAYLDEDPELYGTQIENTATFTWDEVSDSDSASFMVEIAPAMVSISKEVTALGRVPLGGMVTYTLTLSNSGQVDADNVSLEDSLPEGMTIGELVGGSPGEIDPDTNSLSWSGTVLAEDEVVIAFTAYLDEDPELYGTEIENTATFTWDEVSDSDSASFMVELSPATLSISKEVTAPSRIALGEMVTYTITLSNSGQAEAEDVLVEDTLPEGMIIGELVNDSPGEIDQVNNSLSWSGTVPGEDEVVITFTAYVDEDPALYGTEIVNTATFEWEDVSDSDSASFMVELSPAELMIEKSVTPEAEVPLGGQVVFTITLTNLGATPAINIVMTDVLPESLTVVSVDGGGSVTGNTVTWTGAISGQGIRTIVITANLAEDYSLFGQEIENTVTFTSGNAGGGQASATFKVVEMPVIYLPLIYRP